MIYKKEINGVKFTLVCESWSTRDSWGHKVTLYKNDTVKIGSYKVRYYNKTWEAYQYQSTIKGIIYNAIEAIKTALKDTFKNVRGYKIITAKRAKEFAAYLKENTEYNTYNELYRMF